MSKTCHIPLWIFNAKFDKSLHPSSHVINVCLILASFLRALSKHKIVSEVQHKPGWKIASRESSNQICNKKSGL